MKEIIGQILGIVVTVICIVAPQFKRKWQLLAMTLLANVLSGLNFLLLDQIAATGVSVVAILQILIGLWHEKKGTRAHMPEIIAFSLLYVAGGLLPYLVSGTLHTFGWLDVFPIVGALLLMCSVAQKREQPTRIFSLCNAGVFTVYNAIIQNTQIFAQLFSIASNSIALYRYRRAYDADRVEGNTRVADEPGETRSDSET